MKFLLLIYGDEAAYAAGGEAAADQMYAEHARFAEALHADGRLGAASELQPSHTARSVRIRDRDVLVTDGPFAEAREQLGGFYVIEAASMDEACAWAARVPGADAGTIEVRPLGTGGAPT